MSDNEIREFWVKSLFEQMYAVHPSKRMYGHWRMSHATFNLIRTLKTGTGDYLWTPTLDQPSGYVLLGRPVEFDDDAEGAVLVVPEGAR